MLVRVARQEAGKVFLPPSIFPVAAGIILFFGLGTNPLLGLLAVAALLIGSALLWRSRVADSDVYVWLSVATGLDLGFSS